MPSLCGVAGVDMGYGYRVWMSFVYLIFFSFSGRGNLV